MTDVSGISRSGMTQTQQTQSTVGTMGAHTVQIGDGPAINLQDIKTNKVPFQGFRTATKIESARSGMASNASALGQALTCKLDAKALLQDLKTFQLHLDRHMSLHPGLSKAQMDQEALAAMAPQVERMSNAELAAAYQGINSADTALLKSALQHEAAMGNADAKAALANLMNFEALLLVEVGNRVAVGRNPDIAAQVTPLSEMYQSATDPLGEHSGGGRVHYEHDISSANLESLVLADVHSNVRKARAETELTQKLSSRGVQGIAPREMGDILRSSELTMNVNVDRLLDRLDDSSEPWKNAHHLVQEGNEEYQDTLSSGYMMRRDATEKALFPELEGRQIDPNERPIYAALNPTKNVRGAAGFYGGAVVVLKPEVARRATYTIDDTFFGINLKVDQGRINTFFELIPGFAGEGKGKFSADTVAKLTDPSTFPNPLRTAFENHLQGLMNKDPVTARDIEALDEFKELLPEDDLILLQALGIKTFADAEANRGVTATYDNIESLLTRFSPIDNMQLANAALKHREGGNDRAVITSANYVEAQVQGPLILDRDVAEIRIHIDELSPQNMQKLNQWGQEHGVKITLFGEPEMLQTSEGVDQAKESGNLYAASHLDQAVVTAERDRIAGSDEALMQKIAERTASNSSILSPFGGEQPLKGAALQYVKAKFAQEVNEALRHPDGRNLTEEMLINNCFDKAVLSAVKEKSALMRELNQLEFKTPEQKQAFTEWVLSARTLRDPNEMKMLYNQAMHHSEVIQNLVESGADSKQVQDALTTAFRETDEACGTYYRSINKKAEPDDKYTELNRTAFLSTAFLRTSGMDMQAVYDLVDQPETREYFGVCSKLSDPFDGIPGNRDFQVMSSVVSCYNFLHMSAGKEVGEEVDFLPKDLRSYEQMEPELRNKIQDNFPHAMAEINAKHPFSGAPAQYQTFPVASHPERMPQNLAQRRQFLVDTLPAYQQHENTFDRDNAVHGRNHVIRSFIYATAMSNILQEKGIPVDQTAVLCGISGHDMGRKANGRDLWEADSANLTVTNMQRQYGADSMGAAYETEVKKQIDGHSGQTVEAMVMQSADSLDIGRTQEFDPDKLPFLKDTFKCGDKFYTGDNKMRQELAKEAKLLQTLTSPAAAHREEMNQLQVEAISSSDPEAVMEKFNQLKARVAEETAAQRAIGNEDLVQYIEGVIKLNPQLFPVLSKYYR